MVKVVWALQSPTLLNLLAQSKHWDFQVADLGDTGFAECSLCTAPKWDGAVMDVELAFVASPDQYRAAVDTFPVAKVVQVAHQGYHFNLPYPELAYRVVCFNTANADQVRSRLPFSDVLTIVPWFEPDPVWSWRENDVWTTLSRPATRHPMASAGVREVVHYLAGRARHSWYGEGQDGGFLDRAAMAAKLRSSSCYLTVLPPKSGVGLSEHECMASGVPLVGARWGHVQLASLRDFWDFDLVVQDVLDCAHDQELAYRHSEAGLEYVASYHNRATMDGSVRHLLDKWL